MLKKPETEIVPGILNIIIINTEVKMYLSYSFKTKIPLQ